MDYTLFPNFPSTLWLLIAPPAWGKTYRLLTLMRQRPDVQFLFVSPLRALANEFYDKTKEEFKTLLIENKNSWKKLKAEHQLIIVTPETLGNNLKLLNQSKPCLIILDEIHLYFYWGTTFRERMWESLINILCTEFPVLGLTATLGASEEAFLLEQIKNQVATVIKLNLGNQKLINLPQKHWYITTNLRQHKMHFVEWELENKKNTGTVLFFVQYRDEVELFTKLFKEKGFRVLSCIGGQATQFGNELKEEAFPELIVCTTALSHGVNLPPIKAIVLAFPLKNLDFWVQMVGRGGRKGEVFKLYSMDQFMLKPWSKLFSLVRLSTILALKKLEPWTD